MFKSNSLQKFKKKFLHIFSQVGVWGFHTAPVPERDHVAQFGRKAAELIGRQVQVDQVGQFGDVWRDAGQVVVIDVQRGEVGEGP